MSVRENCQRIIESFEKSLGEEKEINRKYKQDIDNKESEFSNIKRELERLGKAYESKIDILNHKINLDKEKISEFKNDLRSKNEHFTEANLFNNELKIQIKSLKSQIENKN